MRKACVVLLFCALVAPALLAQRSLRWTSVDVDARLEADGSLRVRERQAYVFDGDWNGGERTFRLEPGQELDFHGITRLDPATGTEIPLSQGGLSLVDEYAFTDAKTLRWRSRLPEDPPFSGAQITYVLDYTLRNILLRKGDGYLLDHEFLFSDRSGPIERFTLDLEIDPAWRAEQAPIHREIEPVADGEAALVRVPLEYVGAGAPAARPDPGPRRAAQLGLIALGALISWLAFARREKRVGRFDPLPEVDPAWIEKNLLPIRAEVVGAAWDNTVSQSEVAAMLARLVAEKKIETQTVGTEGDPELHMTLKVPREELSGYERELVDKFFFSGNTTSTETIRAHYKSSGFNPSSVINPAVTKEMDALLGGTRKGGNAGCLLGIVVLAMIGIAVAVMPAERKAVAIVSGIVLFILLIVGSILANYWNSRADYGRMAAIWLLALPWAAMAAVVAVLSMLAPPLLVEMLFTAAAIAGFASTASVAASKRSREAIEFRRKLAAVRGYFERELALERPRLEDAWFPYVLAFGLGTEAEKWFKAFGGTTGARASSFTHSTTSSSSGSHASGWSGGGGAFGGAGASGAWVAAASGMAAGVASPSSSSSGGGGGGGSSGGGGGGGW